ncbi:MAG: prohibitin family protein [Chloroflexi bacterium]|nr:prohibitin family protein [Chloroflexota bacterium]
MPLIVAVLGAIAILVGFGLRTAAAEPNGEAGKSAGLIARPLMILGLLLVVASPILSAAVQVPPGNRGVVTWFGSVENRILGEGLTFVTPFAEQVILIDVRVQPHQFKEIDASSQEYQTVKLSGTMNFHLDPLYVQDLYQKVGLDFASNVIDPAFNDFMKEVMPTYPIGEILPKRDEIRKKAITKLSDNLVRYHIIIDDIYIANIAFSPQYTQAIEDKQTQQQRVETERQILAQREIQAQQQVAQAKGEADSAVVRGTGQAEANRKLAESLSPNVIEWQYVQKLSDKVQVMLVPSGQPFLFDMKGLTTAGAAVTGTAAPATAAKPSCADARTGRRYPALVALAAAGPIDAATFSNSSSAIVDSSSIRWSLTYQVTRRASVYGTDSSLTPKRFNSTPAVGAADVVAPPAAGAADTSNEAIGGGATEAPMGAPVSAGVTVTSTLPRSNLVTSTLDTSTVTVFPPPPDSSGTILRTSRAPCRPLTSVAGRPFTVTTLPGGSVRSPFALVWARVMNCDPP